MSIRPANLSWQGAGTEGNGRADPMNQPGISGNSSRTYRLARISTLTALSVIGSFIHLPGPVSTVAFDSAPGYFAALFFGPWDGAAVSAIGHVATSIVNGFPLGVLHIPIAIGLAGAGAATGILNRRFGYAVGVVAGVSINTGLIVLAVPTLGWASTMAFLPFLLFASCVNGIVGALAYIGIRGRIRI